MASGFRRDITRQASWAFPVPLMACRTAMDPPAAAARAAAERPAAAPPRGATQHRGSFHGRDRSQVRLRQLRMLRLPGGRS
eukprot:5276610-Heterocapsa_arctica.AAC.1